MSLDYQKLKRKHADDGSFWTSYSDLFMVLCVVFLLLYVVASLRSGSFSVQKQLEYSKLKAEAQDYKKQIQAYNALKDDYLKKEASQDEAKMYEELMGRLSLLQDEANQEKLQLEAQAKENEAKAEALNEYQQMVRNIINTNLLSNKKIKVRNELIVKKNESIKEMDHTIQVQNEDLTQKAQVIRENEEQLAMQEQKLREKQAALEIKRQEVSELAREVQEKSQTINANEQRISGLNTDLSQKIKELEKTHDSAKSTRAELSRKIAMMKLDNAKKVSKLRSQTENMNKELHEAQGALQDAKGKLSQTEAEKRRLEELKHKMAAEKAALDERVASLKDEVGQTKEQLDKTAKAAAEFKKKLDDAKKEHGRYLASIDQLKKEKDGLSGDLKRAQEVTAAKKKLAKKIAANLAKQGINAGVDQKTGDVTIQFGDEYFDMGKSELKPNMKTTLKKFVPNYSKSLFDDPKIAKEIQSLEIIGFSSPTYRGKYVDPQSLKEEDRTAIDYNLDLSYNRAKSIFSYMFDKKSMTYKYQKEMLPLVKVTGRSFLAEEMKGRDIASGIPIKEYCAKYDCDKSQKVIIKFNLKD